MTSEHLRKEILRELMNRSTNVGELSTKATTPFKGSWTDEQLDALVSTIYVPEISPKQELLIISRFFDFYFSGNIRENDNVAATIVEAILLLKVGESRAIRPRGTSSEGSKWYTPNESNELFTAPRNTAALDELEFPEAMDSELEKEQYIKLMGTFTEENQEKFSNSVADQIYKASRGEPFHRLRNLTCCLALIALRSVCKDPISVRNAYAKSQLRKNLNSLIGFDTGADFIYPCKDFVTKIYQSFNNLTATTRFMFALIVHTFIHQEPGSSEELIITAIYGATVLTHTSRTGLGLIQLISQAQEATSWKWTRIMELSLLTSTMESWERAVTFLEANVGPTPEDQVKSWQWSRIISDGHNRFLSQKENINLCVILAACAVRICGTGVWKAEWAKGLGTRYNSFKEIGTQIYQMSGVEMKDLLPELNPELRKRILQAAEDSDKGKAVLPSDQRRAGESDDDDDGANGGEYDEDKGSEFGADDL